MDIAKLAVAAAALIMWLSAAVAAEGPSEAPAVLEAAHAHNDYRHDRPLLDALDHGFCSVEADIFLVDGRLLVGHERGELKPARTLQSLYLDPLRRHVIKNGSRVYRGGPEFTLLVDIKSDGEKTYRRLHQVLAEYDDIITSVEDGAVRRRAVRAIISGNRARSLIAADSPRYASIDGRLSDLDSDAPSHLLPLISDNWRIHFRWRGEGPMPEREREKLSGIVEQAHQRGRRVRFWATPESPRLWEALHNAGVDLINTDDLAGLQRFLLETRQTPAKN